MEFAHNRVTLERVQKALNGSTLECSMLYCGLVPETIVRYKDTMSRTMFCVASGDSMPTHPGLAEVLKLAQVYNIVSVDTCYTLSKTYLRNT